MAIITNITTIPPAGHRGADTRSLFVSKQEAFQDALSGVFVTEINTLSDEINAEVAAISGLASSASVSAASASSSAASALLSANESESWANQSALSANFKGTWAIGTSYLLGDLVYGSDNTLYRAMQNSTGIDPISDDDDSHWKQADKIGFTVVPLNISNEVVVNSSINYFSIRFDLNPTTTIFFSTDSSNNSYAIAYDHTTNTVGSAVLFHNVSSYFYRLKVDDNRFILVMSNATASTAIRAIAFSVSGTTITVGTPATFTATNNVQFVTSGGQLLKSFIEVDGSYVFTYQKATATPSLCLMPLTLSGTTITLGAEHIVDSQTNLGYNTTYLDRHSAGLIMVAYGYGGYSMSVMPVSISGTTLTNGTKATQALTTDFKFKIYGKVATGRYIGIATISSVVKPILIGISGTTATITVFSGTPASAFTTDAKGDNAGANTSTYVIDNNSILLLNNAFANVITDSSGTLVLTQYAFGTSDGVQVGSNKIVGYNSSGYMIELTLALDSLTLTKKEHAYVQLAAVTNTKKLGFNNIYTSPITDGVKFISLGNSTTGDAMVYDTVKKEYGTYSVLATDIGISGYYGAHLNFSFINAQIGSNIYLRKVYV